jgi:hypothetical protein
MATHSDSKTLVEELPTTPGNMGNQKAAPMQCTSLMTKEKLGYLTTYDANVSIVDDINSKQVAQVYWVYKGGRLCLAKDTVPQERWLGPGYPKEETTAVWGLGKDYCYLNYDSNTGTLSVESDQTKVLMLYWDGSYVRWGVKNENTISVKFL